MASAYFGFMFGTMANSLAAMDELQRRFGPSPRPFLVIPLARGVLSDFANLLAIVCRVPYSRVACNAPASPLPTPCTKHFSMRVAHLVDVAFGGNQRRRDGKPRRVDAQDQPIRDGDTL